ncbi:hypothetical protein CS542_09455 [Pedobacter sp. IW39]|nr:hypothetical protein CS542_09455 [Pedobacter sp. IW39]
MTGQPRKPVIRKCGVKVTEEQLPVDAEKINKIIKQNMRQAPINVLKQRRSLKIHELYINPIFNKLF